MRDTGFRERIQKKGPSLTARAAAPDDGMSFAGAARKAAKISVSVAPVEKEALSDLVTWCVKNDQAMRHHDPAIAATAASARIAEENRNVSVDGWVQFAKKESDNDYHLIVATKEDRDSAQLMNAEISGLPPHGSHAYASLNSARASFENIFELALRKMRTGGYAKLTPTHVRITGSLFYDIDHAAGGVGPAGYRAHSAWEIHPITAIKQLP